MDGEAKRKKKKSHANKKITMILSILFVVVLTLLIAIIAAQKLGNMTISTMTSDVKAYFMSIGRGKGFPYDVDAQNVVKMKVNNSNIFMLFKDKTLILTQTAKEIMPQSHTYSSPSMKTKGSRIIVYDIDSGKFRVQSGTEVLKEYELDYDIMSAAIGRSGNYAVGTYSDSAQSVLTVYNSKHEKEFVWNFKTERIIDISLSDNGKNAAVAVVGANNGQMYSKLYVFSFNLTEYVSCFDYPATTIVKVDYVKGNNIIAVADNLRSYITDNTDRHDDSRFNSDTLHNYCITDNGRSAIVLSKYGSESLSNLTLYSNSNKEEFTLNFDKEIKYVDCDSKYTAVLFDNEVRTYNKSGEQVGSISFDGEPISVLVDGRKTYLLTSVSVKCYNTKGTTAEDR